VKLSLSEISTVGASFEEDVRAYAAAGFDGIGIWESKLPADDATNVVLLREAGLGVASCVPLVPSILPLGLPGMEGPPDPAERIETLRTSIRRLAAYDPECVLCLTGPAGELDEERAREIAIQGLRDAAAAARDAGVRFGLEPATPRQRDTVSFVNSVADAVALLDEAGLPEVGIMVDTYNLWHEPPAALAAVADRVTGLHVADQPADHTRDDRVLPGEDGGTRSDEQIHALAAAGWNGYLDVEIFSTPDRFWGLSPGEAARRAHAAISSIAQTLP